MPENRVHTAVKKLLKKANPQRIETWTGSGVFDSNWQTAEGDLWIEYKELPCKIKHPVCDYKIPLKPSQITWSVRRIADGAKNLFVAVLIGKELLFIRLSMERIALIREAVPFAALKELDIKTRKQMKLPCD